MKAVVYHGVNDLRLDEVPEPEIENPADVILKITLSSICASDIHIKEAGLHTPGKIIGHEFCGIIEEIGSGVRYLQKGDRVVGKPYSNCGYCFFCKRGQPELCDKSVLFGVQGGQGVQAEYARIPWAENALCKIPDGLQFEDVIFVGDILSTGLTGILRGRLAYGDTVAIFGAGPVGLSAALLSPLLAPAKLLLSICWITGWILLAGSAH